MVSNSKYTIIDQDPEEETILLTKQEYESLKAKAKEAEDLYNKFLRLTAEFENYQKFMERQKADYLKYGTERILREIIKIYDDLKRALKGKNDDSQNTNGLKLILNNFSALLKREGVNPIEAEGAKFNPDLHECMMVEQNPSADDETITEVLEDGYFLNGKVMRPARVKINNKCV
ncbi:MAG TPA: nucleotide exchange factor GrpE [Candidatus Deferrimicrobium sp.]|nr:nucleotide exchange factor GrpE [Candidatus Deferrimicrobium sp.]